MQILSAKYSEQPIGMSNHYHDCHQILYIVSGKVIAKIGEKEYCAEDGSVLILSRFEEHSIRLISSEYKRYTLRISADIFRGSEENALLFSVLVNRAKGFSHLLQAQEFAPLLKSLFEQMTQEYAQKAPLHEKMLTLCLNQILITLYRINPALFLSQNHRGNAMVKEIQSRLEEQYGHPITLNDLANDYHISPSHLSHLFKKITGYSIMEYLQVCRLSAAKKALSSSDQSIKEIVSKCGFGDESNFSRMFKERTGMTPTSFRKKYQIH